MNLENPRAEFEKYQQEHEGDPIDPSATAEAKRELLLDKMHARGEREKEPDRKAIIASIPKGRSSEITLAEENIPQAIEKLKDAMEILIPVIDLELFGDPVNATFGSLGKILREKESGATPFGKVNDAVESIEKYMEIDPETTLTEVPQLIQEFLSVLTRRQRRLKEDTGG